MNLFLIQNFIKENFTLTLNKIQLHYIKNLRFRETQQGYGFQKGQKENFVQNISELKSRLSLN